MLLCSFSSIQLCVSLVLLYLQDEFLNSRFRPGTEPHSLPRLTSHHLFPTSFLVPVSFDSHKLPSYRISFSLRKLLICEMFSPLQPMKVLKQFLKLVLTFVSRLDTSLSVATVCSIGVQLAALLSNYCHLLLVELQLQTTPF